MSPVIDDLIIRLIGSTAGAALALVMSPPRSRSGFVRRCAAAMICGMVFPSYVREWLQFSADAEGMIAASCLMAFVSWQAMGAIKRAVDRWQEPKNGD